MILRKVIRLLVWMTFTLVFFILITNIWVVQSTSDQIHTLDTVPYNDVALILGTSKRTSKGEPNRFFEERMNTVAALHKEEQVRHILVSGDNGSKYYNEPRDMLNALGDLNIPDTVISMDYAGFRTLDSVVRCKEVFGQKKVTIVTQEFHCYRSLFIANYFDIEAVAISADDGGPVGKNLAFREVLARTVAVIDLYIMRTQPKYLGEQVNLNIN